MIHIFDHVGVHLHVDYTPGSDGPTFHSVRVLDANYRPTGPDLQHLLHEALLPVSGEVRPGGSLEAMTFLSAITADLP